MIPRPLREAARLVLLDAGGAALLVRYHGGEREPRSYWATPGGALEPGESYRDAAARELLEETGLTAEIGPEVWRREFDLVVAQGPVHQVERFFLVRVAGVAPSVANSSPEAIRELRWWSLAEIEATREVIFPDGFALSLAGVL